MSHRIYSASIISTVRSLLLYGVCISAFAGGPRLGAVGSDMAEQRRASTHAIQLVNAFGHARDMKERMQSPELRDANPAFARIATMPETELANLIAGVFDTIASAKELSEVSRLLKSRGGKILARDYNRILKDFACDVQAYSLAIPASVRSTVQDAGRSPGWLAMRRIGGDSRYFGLVLERVMALGIQSRERPMSSSDSTI